ncbi:thermonuclease family protein [Tropicimonas sp. IMCC6043]|uniref:thermonuclease family protein n=1 Tax=Tropicimonas sp. IMCC6043 TaxID=2510645 RepID=UPI0013EAF742|nr:thermonuclease family protein [Tropicimonas sp. IMCC6043]
MMVLATGFALLLAASQGEVFVAQGDTIVIAGTPIRISGIDMPRASHREAERARNGMQEIVRNRFVACRVSDEMVSNHRLGNCTADGEDIAATLVALGLALDCERYSEGRYRALEPAGARERLTASPDCRD